MAIRAVAVHELDEVMLEAIEALWPHNQTAIGRIRARAYDVALIVEGYQDTMVAACLLTHCGTHVYLECMAVTPAWRRRGWCRALCAEAQKVCDTVVLDVSKSQLDVVLPVFEKCGFGAVMDVSQYDAGRPLDAANYVRVVQKKE